MCLEIFILFSLKRFDGSFDVMETQKTQQPPGVFIGTSDIVGFHNTEHHKNGILIPSRRRIFLLPLAIFFRKYSCLVPVFNKNIEMLHTGGLIDVWTKVYQKMPMPRREKHLEPKQLSIEQVGGIYIIAAYAYALCLFVFFGELISQRIQWLRVLFQYL